MFLPIKLAAVVAELPMHTGMYGRCKVRTTFVRAETQDVDAYFFVLFETKKCFFDGGYVEVVDRPLHMSLNKYIS